MVSNDTSYIFLDEGGNLDFSDKGSEYFTLTGVLMKRPFSIDPPLTNLRFDLIEAGVELEEFHAAEDRQATRNQVFSCITSNLDSGRADSVIVEKRKTHPKLQDPHRFYPEMLGYLLRWMVNEESLDSTSEVIVVTDVLPVNKKRRALEKAVKTTLKKMLPPSASHRVMHHDSRSCCGLQVADYLNWAVQRKWERDDDRSYKLIQTMLKSEFAIFRHGKTIFY